MLNTKHLAVVLALLSGAAHAQTATSTTFQSPRLQATSPLVGCIPVYQPLSSPPWRKLCNTDNFATAFGYTTVPVYNTTGDREVGNPPNPTGTTSATPLMMGLSAGAGNQPTILTPNSSGTYQIYFTGWGTNTNAANGGIVQCYYGTGTPPANAAAVTGTSLGTSRSFLPGAGVRRFPFYIATLLTGLSVGTSYWLDCSLGVLGGAGTASISAVKPIAIER